MIPSFLTFEFDLILRVFLSFGGQNGMVSGSDQCSTTVFRSNHIVEQLSFSVFLSILTFDFNLILGSFFTFLGPNGLFWGQGGF